jgi:hypothetical protein
MQGPLGDYAVVIWYHDGGNLNVDGNDTGSRHNWWNIRNRDRDNKMGSAIRTAIVNGGNQSTLGWRPRDTMARLTDGTSNTLIVGEKHVTALEMGRDCCNNKRADGNIYWWDGGWREYTVGRQARNIIPLAPHGQFEQTGDWAARDTAFGSWHPGAIQFLLGDGRIVSVNVDMNVKAFRELAHCQDGRVANLNR